MKKSIAILACAMTVLTGCATLNNLAKGSLIGGVGGGAVGAGVINEKDRKPQRGLGGERCQALAQQRQTVIGHDHRGGP